MIDRKIPINHLYERAERARRAALAREVGRLRLTRCQPDARSAQPTERGRRLSDLSINRLDRGRLLDFRKRARLEDRLSLARADLAGLDLLDPVARDGLRVRGGPAQPRGLRTAARRPGRPGTGAG